MSSLENKFFHWLLTWIVCFLLWSCMSSLYILDIEPLSDKRKVKVKSLSRVQFSATPWTVDSRQEYWSGFHFLFQRIFPTQGSNPSLLHCRQMLYCLSRQGSLLSDIWFANIFSHAVGCFIILLICRSFFVWCSPAFFFKFGFRACGISIPQPGIEPMHWKIEVLTTGPLGKSVFPLICFAFIACSFGHMSRKSLPRPMPRGFSFCVFF